MATSALAYTLAFTDTSATKAKTAAKIQPKAGSGFFSRIFAAMATARLRQAEREVANYLADTGGKFTDEAEREIERRFLSNQSHW